LLFSKGKLVAVLLRVNDCVLRSHQAMSSDFIWRKRHLKSHVCGPSRSQSVCSIRNSYYQRRIPEIRIDSNSSWLLTLELHFKSHGHFSDLRHDHDVSCNSTMLILFTSFKQLTSFFYQIWFLSKQATWSIRVSSNDKLLHRHFKSQGKEQLKRWTVFKWLKKTGRDGANVT